MNDDQTKLIFTGDGRYQVKWLGDRWNFKDHPGYKPQHYDDHIEFSPVSTTNSPVTPLTWKGFDKKENRAVSQEIQYHPGQKVLHPMWGDGLVIDSQPQDDDEIVDVFFDGVGKKKLIASLANLKTVSSD